MVTYEHLLSRIDELIGYLQLNGLRKELPEIIELKHDIKRGLICGDFKVIIKNKIYNTEQP